MQIESNDAHVNDLDSALPDYMWDKQAKEQFIKQKNRKMEIEEKKIDQNLIKKEEVNKKEE